MSFRQLKFARQKLHHLLKSFSMTGVGTSPANGDSERKPTRWRPVALDGGYGWAVVFGSFMIHVFADGFVYSFGVIAESLVQEFKATNAEISFILSLLTGLMLAAGPIASVVSNRIGCRLTTIGGAFIASFGCAMSYFAESMGYLTFSVGIVMGFGFGMMYCPAIMIVTMYFERLRSLATGITVCGAGVGTFVFSRIISYLIVRFNWRTVFLIYAGVVILCVPCGALYRPIAFEPIYEDEEDEKKKVKAVDQAPTITSTNGSVKPEGNFLHPDRNGVLRAAVSHTDVSPRPSASNLQRVRSLGEHLPHHTKKDSHSESLGYLNVRDVFYQRSVSELKNFDEVKMRSVHSLPSAHKESTTKSKEVLPELVEVDEENEDSAATSGSRAIAIWHTLKKMMDLSLLTEPIYILFAISNFLTSIGFNAPPMFMPMNAETVLKLSKIDSANTVAAYGLANTFGRIFFGLCCDRQLPFKWGKDTARNRLWIYNITLMLCGIASCFVFKMEDYYSFVGYCFFFGFTISSYVCLTSVVLVDLIGLEKLTNGLGLLLLVQGIATFVGPPIAGQLYDMSKRYDWTFVFCGVCLFVSGLMLFTIPWFRERAKREHHEAAPPTGIRLEDREANATAPILPESTQETA
ncbi:MFS domain-containing protein [Aphelenchoides besseyi]|nr:MFS domain-containing protein [Aphelenchoides besseyi]KAI6209693.1 MFS domain-containing protein [Aphelenchoides besseyi]